MKADDQAVTALARNALAQWGFEGATLALQRHDKNAVFRVAREDGRAFALKVYRPDRYRPGELESLRVWTDELVAAGLPIPNAVKTLDGRACAKVPLPGSKEARHVGMTEWVEGVTLRQWLRESDCIAERNKRFAQIGALLAKFHDLSMRWSPPPGFRQSAWDVERLLGGAAKSGRFWEIKTATAGDRKRLRAIRDGLRERLAPLSKASAAYGMIHADLNSKNLLIDRGRLVVIDFDNAGFGWYNFDLGVALWHQLGGIYPPSATALAGNVLLSAYRNHRPDGAETDENPLVFLLVRWLLQLSRLESGPGARYRSVVPLALVAIFAHAEVLGL